MNQGGEPVSLANATNPDTLTGQVICATELLGLLRPGLRQLPADDRRAADGAADRSRRCPIRARVSPPIRGARPEVRPPRLRAPTGPGRLDRAQAHRLTRHRPGRRDRGGPRPAARVRLLQWGGGSWRGRDRTRLRLADSFQDSLATKREVQATHAKDRHIRPRHVGVVCRDRCGHGHASGRGASQSHDRRFPADVGHRQEQGLLREGVRPDLDPRLPEPAQPRRTRRRGHCGFQPEERLVPPVPLDRPDEGQLRPDRRLGGVSAVVAARPGPQARGGPVEQPLRARPTARSARWPRRST